MQEIEEGVPWGVDRGREIGVAGPAAVSLQ